MSRILIIEDDQKLRRQLAQVLRFEGFDPHEAANGKLGVAAALTAAPDLVICDIMMPELDGFGVLQALRENPRTALTPFIFLTAKVAAQDWRQGMEAGADDYITKPYDPDALVASVRRRLEKRQRQMQEARRRVDEVSLALAGSLPVEFSDALEHITRVSHLLALKYPADDPQVAAMQQAVSQESARLQRMLRRLHVYAQLPQLYANRFEVERSVAQGATAGVVAPVARDAAQRWQRRDDLVLTTCEATIPMSDEYLTLVVEELVENACKFSPPGTCIEVASATERAHWSLTVGNQGPGLSEEQIAQIGAFRQFWTGAKKPRGLGLGLALAQGIARLHGCEFTLRSDAGVTRATLLVPLEN